MLFLIIWEPVPATRRILTIVVFLAVIVGGAYALRKLTLEEHPDAALADRRRRAAAGRGGHRGPAVTAGLRLLTCG